LSCFAVAAPVASAGAAQPELPKPRSTVVKPNVGVGGMRLGKRLRPLPKGWKHPFSCTALQGLSGCAWTTRKDALPPPGQTGIKGPYVIVAGRRNVVGIIVSSGGKEVDAGPLRRWKTRKGIGFTSTLDEFRRTYPSAQVNPSTGSYRIIAGGNITTFVFAGGVLNTIEMITCAEQGDC
jgi:hypothetical protein